MRAACTFALMPSRQLCGRPGHPVAMMCVHEHLTTGYGCWMHAFNEANPGECLACSDHPTNPHVCLLHLVDHPDVHLKEAPCAPV